MELPDKILQDSPVTKLGRTMEMKILKESLFLKLGRAMEKDGATRTRPNSNNS